MIPGVFVVLLFFSQTSLAAANNVESFAPSPVSESKNSCSSADLSAAHELIAYLSSMRHWQADFKQEVLMDGKIINKQSGTVYLKRPGYLRWDIQKPFKQIIWFEPQQITSYDLDLDQAIIRSFEPHNRMDHPIYLLSASEQKILDCAEIKVKKALIDKQKTASPISSYSVHPAKMDNYQQIKLHYHQNTLDRMEITTSDNQVIKLQFSNIKNNPKFSQKLFKFTPQTNTEVLSE